MGFYDAAGNMTNDDFHTYSYDGEGNIVSMDANGSTAQYAYNALNQRVAGGPGLNRQQLRVPPTSPLRCGFPKACAGHW